MSHSNNPLPRRVRIVVVCGVLLGLLFFFAGLGRHLPHLPSQLHYHLYHNASNVAAAKECSSFAYASVPRWSDFAYVQYVTNPSYLCNSLMILEALRRHGTKADLVMLYPQQWSVPTGNGSDSSYESRLLAHARDLYGTKLSPIHVKTFVNKGDPTWQDSYTKLFAWNQTQYKRVISLDSDATVFDHMDELFLLPSAPVAMPRAYWMEHFFLSSQLIVVEPSAMDWERIQEAIEHHEGFDYDMDILNKLYGTSSTVIPHRKYDLLTGEIRPKSHDAYLGSKEVWQVKDVLSEAKYVHFSDWPMPKPWLEAAAEDWEKYKPDCQTVSENERDCSDQEAWFELRRDFTARRERICGHAYDGKAPKHQKRASDCPRHAFSII